MNELFLGLDLGTSGLKAAAVHADGHVVAQVEAAYAPEAPKPGFAQIDPPVWDAAVGQALAQLGGLRFAAVGIAGQMHGVVLLDASGTACRSAILWPDRRAESQLALWRDLTAEQRARLANPLAAGMAGPILVWLQDNDPSALRDAALAVQPKDYLRTRLGGPAVSERSDASATLLWDIPADTWAMDVVAEVGLPAHLLADIVPSDGVVATAALPGDPALVAGAGDTPAALLGLGGLADGQVQINVGSGVQILMNVGTPAPVQQPVTHLYADAAGGWYAMCAIQNGGLALDRMRHWLQLDWDQLFGGASGASPGAGGVSVLPFLSGERGGVASPHSRGAWVGLHDKTTRGDLARAAVEGMVFSMRRGLELLDRPFTVVQMSGGGARHPIVAQMLADLLAVPVSVVPDRSTSAMGAARLAAAGVGEQIGTVTGHAVSHTPAEAPGLQAAYQLWLQRLGVASA